MGKPASRRQSVHSKLSNASNMSPKNSKEFKRGKQQERIKKSISGLFQKLRERSNSSLNSSGSQNTVIALDNSANRAIKRKVSTNSTSIIEINDDDIVTNNKPCSSTSTPKKLKQSSPMHCSTPLDKKNVVNNNKPSATNLNKDIINLTDIENDTFLTIDLTNASEFDAKTSATPNDTIIDLGNTTDGADCTLVSVSSSLLSMSGESNVTVMNKTQFEKRKTERNMRKFANGIANLNSNEKAKLLELITQNILSGCKVKPNVKNSLLNLHTSVNQATETVEDTYIKEVILGQPSSRNSIGSNIYNPEKDAKNKSGLRMIVIDGSNVAMEHGMHRHFSVKGLKICIDYFLKRGHTVKAFVPRFRCKFGKSSDPRLLDDLERRGYVVYTPSREIQGRMITSYDDRYIIQCAAEFDGVIVTGDNYRDLINENPRWRFVIENRLLPFTWVNDMIMFPRDPLGRNGPTLEKFLKHSKSGNFKPKPL